MGLSAVIIHRPIERGKKNMTYSKKEKEKFNREMDEAIRNIADEREVIILKSINGHLISIQETVSYMIKEREKK